MRLRTHFILAAVDASLALALPLALPQAENTATWQATSTGVPVSAIVVPATAKAEYEGHYEIWDGVEQPTVVADGASLTVVGFEGYSVLTQRQTASFGYVVVYKTSGKVAATATQEFVAGGATVTVYHYGTV